MCAAAYYATVQDRPDACRPLPYYSLMCSVLCVVAVPKQTITKKNAATCSACVGAATARSAANEPLHNRSSNACSSSCSSQQKRICFALLTERFGSDDRVSGVVPKPSALKSQTACTSARRASLYSCRTAATSSACQCSAVACAVITVSAGPVIASSVTLSSCMQCAPCTLFEQSSLVTAARSSAA
eukprot:4984-Heterococcus_DN1.PRE.1